jgi:acyl carrier protein
MEKKEIYEKLTAIFQTVFDDETLVLESTTNSETIDEWDSLAHISLVLSIEKAFAIKFIIGEIQALKDVGGMVTLLSKKIEMI